MRTCLISVAFLLQIKQLVQRRVQTADWLVVSAVFLVVVERYLDVPIVVVIAKLLDF